MKELPPKPVAQDDYLWRVGPFIGGTEIPAKQGSHSQRMEESGTHTLTFETLWFIPARDRRLPRLKDRRGFEGAAALRKFHPGAKSNLRSRTLPGIPDHQNAIRMRIGQRLEENWIDGAEDCRAGADAEPERDNANRGKTRIPAQLAASEAQIAYKCSKGVLPSVGAHLLPGCFRDPTLAARCPASILIGQAALSIIGGNFFEVMPDFFIDFPVACVSMQQPTETTCQMAPK